MENASSYTLSSDYRARELVMLQSLPLDVKIAKSIKRFEEYYEHFNGEIYISSSGGADSEVLERIAAMSRYKDVPVVFCKTTQEWPEITKHIKENKPHFEIIHPAKSFKEIIDKYGYPVVSKEQSQYISEVRNCKDISAPTYNIRMNGNNYGRGKVSEKWKFLIDGPFKISHKCCYYLKKEPFSRYEKRTGRRAVVGTLTEESEQRTSTWKQYGCNSFDKKRPMSAPLSFWTKQDILHFLKRENIKYASCYGDIVMENGCYRFTGTQRTGCLFCLYGIQNECNLRGGNRLQKLHDTHPALYKYGMDTYHLDEILDYMDINYRPYGTIYHDKSGQIQFTIY